MTLPRLMKQRAGLVGARGVGPLLRDILAADQTLRLHLGGHSYGCRVMLAALCTEAPPRKAESLLLLQPAVSRYCFAEQVPGINRPGGYRAAPERLRQPILLTYSAHDGPLHKLFGLAMFLARDIGEPDMAGWPFDNRYAALGGYGPAGVEFQQLPIRPPGEPYPLATSAARILTFDGSHPVGAATAPAIEGHGDVTSEYTGWMLYSQLRAAGIHNPPFQLNAWTGSASLRGEIAADNTGWMAAHTPQPQPAQPFRPEVPELRHWRDVGWGVILPYDERRPAEHQSTADDAPPPIQALVAARGGEVLRYRHGSRLRNVVLYQRGTPIELSEDGEDGQRLPGYLLIYGSPREIPWQIQFALNSAPNRFVGRLDLTGQALANYVTFLQDDWADATASPDTPLIWAVDHGEGDITRLMRNAIAERLFKLYAADTDLGPRARFLDGTRGQGRAEDLIAALAAQRPNLIVTTSHGMTGPLDDRAQLARQLGWLVDQTYQPLDPARLLESWQPDGAIWYAHACCSAGSRAPSAFSGLVSPGSSAHQALAALAGLGDQVAPLPRALLSAAKPLRAFIGHVEPTFDYTLQLPGTNQHLTGGLVSMLNQYAFDARRYPVGMMAQALFARLGHLASQYNDKQQLDEQRAALYYQICFRDLQSTVILGDPTVALPMPPAVS